MRCFLCLIVCVLVQNSKSVRIISRSHSFSSSNLDGETRFDRRLDVDGNSIARRVHGNANGPGTFIEIGGRRVTDGKDAGSFSLTQFEGVPGVHSDASIEDVGFFTRVGRFLKVVPTKPASTPEIKFTSGFDFTFDNGMLVVNPLYGPITRLDCQPVDGETQDGLVKQFTVCPIIGGEIDKDVKTVSFGDGDSKPKTVITIDKLVIKEVEHFDDVKSELESDLKLNGDGKAIEPPSA